MKATFAIMQRELLSLFCTPIGYVAIAAFLLVLGIFMILTGSFEPGQPATLRAMFGPLPIALAVIIPAIGMRSLSEEFRSGTIEGVMTAPVSDAFLVTGKFLAALVFYIVMLATSLVYPLAIGWFGSPDWGAMFSTYIGLVLIGALFTAVSIFTSSLSANQVIAWILAVIPLAFFAVMGFLFVSQTSGILRTVLQAITVSNRFEEASLGILSTGSIVFFVATSAMFLFLTTKIVESRRWR